MKVDNIFVGVNGTTLKLNSGRAAVAVFPPVKGVNASFMLLESGQMAKVEGARINGVGVPRFLKENGFELATPGDKRAELLADRLDVRDGTDLVEAASQTKAKELQARFGGQECTFVPFDETRPAIAVKVEEPGHFSTTLFDLSSGFMSGTVRTHHSAVLFHSDIPLSTGWLVGPGGDAALPRNTEYGGPVELAVYIICNVGLGSLVGKPNLVMSSREQFPRGLMEFYANNGDVVYAGVNAGDELEVEYRRAGAVLYSRAGLARPRLAEIIGCIAAVLVRVSELDAPVKKKLKKAA